jgi:Family of unknown function (DUF6311)
MLESHSIPLIKNTTKMTSPGAVLSAWLAYAMSIALALGILTYLFPWAMFHGDSIIFDFGDNAQHTSGWWYYAKDSWHFPLLHTSRVDHPEGISIAFTDSIPLAALFFKALMTVFPTWFPEHFHYFGWWIGFVFVTQALSATLLMRTLGAKSTFATVLVVLFVLTWPVIHVRYSHAALMLHSILLFGLALYFLGVQHKWRSSIVSAAFIVLHVISLLVHPYFLPFTFGLYFAFMVDHAIQKGDWARQLVRFFVLFAVLIAIALLMGYFGRSTYRGGYGEHYNFNLASPFCADLSKFYPCDIGIPAIAAFEGFNYLGLGLLLLLPIAFVLNWRHILLAPKRYPVLTLILVGMFAYSVTNYVSFGPHRLVYFPLPSWLDWVTGTFRAAGRFFWIIGYLALFLTIASLTKRKKWWLNLVLIAALGIQIVDVKPWLKQIKTLAAKRRALNYEAWTPLMAHIDKIVIYPTFECGRGDLHYYTWIMQLAGYHGKLLNSGYTSRDKKDCPNSELVIQEPLQTRHLYVLATVTYYETPFTKSFKFPTRLQEAIDRGECVKRNDGLMCLPGSKPEFWNNLSLNTYPAKFAENSMFLAGPELNTHIGVPQHQGFNANLVPKNPKQAGWLSFGPSLPLPVGKYKFSLTYLSQEKTTQRVGKWEVVLQQGSAGNEKILFSGDLSGTSGASKQIEGVLAVGESQANMPLDIRTFFLAQGDLELVSISLVKLP